MATYLERILIRDTLSSPKFECTSINSCFETDEPLVYTIFRSHFVQSTLAFFLCWSMKFTFIYNQIHFHLFSSSGSANFPLESRSCMSFSAMFVYQTTVKYKSRCSEHICTFPGNYIKDRDSV